MPIDIIGVLALSDSEFHPGYSSGFQVRGLFYRLLREVDPVLAFRIHESRSLAPFSLTPLIKVNPHTYFFRITSYLTRISDAILRALRCLERFRLMNIGFRVLEVSFRRLDLGKLWREATPYSRYKLEFMTPTCFRRPCPYIPLHSIGLVARILRLMGRPRSNYRFYPLPDPILMLRNLKRQWDEYAGLTLRARGFNRWLEDGGVSMSSPGRED